VLVTEVDPSAPPGLYGGYQVVTLEDAVGTADIFVTATGNRDVIMASTWRR